MIAIRLIGRVEEITASVQQIRQVLDVIEESAPYPCRGNTQQVRIYLRATLMPVHSYWCGTCNGTGLTENATCGHCGGTGIDNHTPT